MAWITRCPNFRLAGDLLGWQPSAALEEGLWRTIGYFREVLEPAREQQVGPAWPPV